MPSHGHLVNRSTVKLIVIAVTGFTALLVFAIWFISLMEFEQLKRAGERPLSLPTLGRVLLVLHHPSWLLPAAAALTGCLLLRTDEPSPRTVSRYCGYFSFALVVWTLVSLLGLYSLYTMPH